MMRLFVTLLLCSLAAGSLAASAGRKARDADDGSGEHLQAEASSSGLINFAGERTPRQTAPDILQIVKNLIFTKFYVVTTLISVLVNGKPAPVGKENVHFVRGSVSEFLDEFPANLDLGSHMETMEQEATLALQDLNPMLDVGAVFAVAELQGGAQGELNFAQVPCTTDDDSVTIITGTLSGLKPGLHKLQVTLKGDISDDCVNVGDAYSDESDGIFVANEEGQALVVVRAPKASLQGRDTVIGRSVVITSETDPEKKEACGVIVHLSL